MGMNMGDESNADVVDPRVEASQGAHPEPTHPSGRIPLTRAMYPPIPTWPTTLIAPNSAELARWHQLWAVAQARNWTEPDRRYAVAALVRLEHRCGHARVATATRQELTRLRHELGLDS
jgi:hypothetical protein